MYLSSKRICLKCRGYRRCRFDPWMRKIPWSRGRQPTPVSLPREFHGHRSLADCGPWDHKESDTMEVTEQQQQYTRNNKMHAFLFRACAAIILNYFPLLRVKLYMTQASYCFSLNSSISFSVPTDLFHLLSIQRFHLNILPNSY